MGWKLKINFSDGSDELVDEVFESKEEALAEFNIWQDGWGAGKEALDLACENYNDAEIEDYDIWEN